MVIQSVRSNGRSLYIQKTDTYYVNYTINGVELGNPYVFDEYKDAIKLYREMESDLMTEKEA